VGVTICVGILVLIGLTVFMIGRMIVPRPSTIIKTKRHDGDPLLALRLVYAMTRGVWPTHQIDHVNRDGLDDRPDNLRDVTCKENNANRKWPNRKGEAVYHKSVA
jgi:hypothetical protein